MSPAWFGLCEKTESDKRQKVDPDVDHTRYIPNNLPNPATLPASALQDPGAQEKLRERLLDGWQHIKRRVTPESTRDWSVYTGLAGIAFLAFKMGESKDNNEGKHLQHIALAYLHAARGELEYRNSQRKRAGISFILGSPGVWAQLAVVEARCNNPRRSEEARRALLELKSEVISGYHPFELLYGAAGYLYSLMFVRQHLGPGAVPSQDILDVVDHIILQGRGGPGGSLTYKWHGKRYIGGAHGLSGIILTLLDAMRFVELTAEQTAALRATIDYIGQTCLSTGNYPSRPEKDKDDALVQWCHGAPGPLMLLARAFEVFKEDTYLAMAEGAADVVWERGILKKGNGLCHGVAGNAYSLLSLCRVTGKFEYLHMARQFALTAEDRTTQAQQRVPDAPYSLFEGHAGLLCLYIDLLSNPSQSRFPAVEI